MSVPSSGVVSFSTLRSVFKNISSGQISFSELFSNNSYTNGISGIPSSGNVLSVSHFLGKSPTLYSFSSITFTSAGAYGQYGPTLSQCRSAYSSQSWTQNSSYFNMTSQGIQLWTVPKTGLYGVVAIGGNRSSGGNRSMCVNGNINLTKGDVIAIVVGQEGPEGSTGYYYTSNSIGWWNRCSSGCGGTFVFFNNNRSLIAACGGVGGLANSGSWNDYPGYSRMIGVSTGDATVNAQGNINYYGTGIPIRYTGGNGYWGNSVIWTNMTTFNGNYNSSCYSFDGNGYTYIWEYCVPGGFGGGGCGYYQNAYNYRFGVVGGGGGGYYSGDAAFIRGDDAGYGLSAGGCGGSSHNLLNGNIYSSGATPSVTITFVS